MMKLRLLLLGVVLCAGVFPASAAMPKNPPGRSKPIYKTSVTEPIYIRTSDGETLAGQITRPVTPARVKVPIILTFSPYNVLRVSTNDPSTLALDGLGKFFVPRGYARVFVDVRGTRDSTGCWDYGGLRERRDGYEVVEALARMPWSSGRVAMIGGSYDGTTATMTAVERPPHLTTVVPIAAIDRWYDYAFHNGVRWLLNSENELDEGIDTPLLFDLGFGAAPSANITGRSFRESTTDRSGECERQDHTQHGYDLSPDYTDFWKQRDYRALLNRVRIPALIAHGLDDYNVKASGAAALWKGLRGPKKMVLGQFPHGSPSTVGAKTWQNILWRWFDQWLLKLGTGLMQEPPVDTQDSTGRWRGHRTWPPAARTITLVPQSDQPVPWIDDPTLTEDRLMDPNVAWSPRFDTAPLQRPIRIVGEPAVTLSMSSNSAETHVAVLLADVAPDGTWSRISRGFFNPRYRRGLHKGEPITPDQRFSVFFSLQPVDHVIPAGHRLVVVVTSSNAVWAIPSETRAINTMYADGSTKFTLPISWL